MDCFIVLSSPEFSKVPLSRWSFLFKYCTEHKSWGSKNYLDGLKSVLSCTRQQIKEEKVSRSMFTFSLSFFCLHSMFVQWHKMGSWKIMQIKARFRLYALCHVCMCVWRISFWLLIYLLIHASIQQPIIHLLFSSWRFFTSVMDFHRPILAKILLF